MTDLIHLDDYIEEIKFKGLGPATVKRLKGKGLKKVEDLLYFFPLKYNELSNFKKIAYTKPEEKVSLKVKVRSKKFKRSFRKKIPMLEAIASDETGNIKLIWFNQPYLVPMIKSGGEIIVFGKTQWRNNDYCMVNPVVRFLEAKEFSEIKLEIEPVYSSIEKVSNAFLKKLISFLILNTYPLNFSFPDEVRERFSFPEKRECFKNIHFPQSIEEVRKIENFSSIYQQALIFEELFEFFLGVFTLTEKEDTIKKEPVFIDEELRKEIDSILPFKLTDEQKRVLNDIYKVFEKGNRLVRLVQGDVGSGKTIVSVLAALPFLKKGYQVALIAPTEILARQHYKTIEGILQKTGIPVFLLTGSTSKKEKQKIYSGLESGIIKFIVGTHALIQPEVKFNNLQFVIIDEQHRFGVEQRQILVEKGDHPHILSLTATPIPRTLAMTLYGHYDYDAIKSKPPGRKEVKTIIKKRENDFEVYKFVYKMAKINKIQSYFVYPLIDTSDALELTSATEKFEELSNTYFKDLKTAMIHGKMKPQEKEDVMKRFQQGEIDILFSTTVIEVGVDVPNANIMVIENAERFGLSQLHQLRGRIGRGEEQAYCFLIVDRLGENAYKRIKIMSKTSDGFLIAEQDLKIRGPGEFLGTRQSGLPDFKIADILRDARMVEEARNIAKQYVYQGKLTLNDSEKWKKKFGKALV
ncbi:ATP-dependent DNA helicase RecG [Thermotomaculum hydrothermale]|uniref:ATP-dependent DNA helicase RecG n=1 Tax=Thermotomaculum hydrothermale TaxID=981385 RepID=A0A7R6PH10_9BACT|nr:ATP-dependent DNA helicase RecG [Thermotomaculum hydrothermale]BBB32454.1 ATP-dependent DNA helicase RecG [Thermotomaculum hydrothermale]